MNEEQTATATTHTIAATTVTDTGAIATLLMHAVPENTVREIARQMETGIAHLKAETAMRAALGLKRCGAKVQVVITIED